MRLSWGLVVAMGLLCASVFALTAALRPFVRDAMQPRGHIFTQQQIDEEMAKWHADAQASR